MFQNRCRKILCPQCFYIYRGKCVPAYLETISHAFLTAVKVSLSNTSSKLYIKKRKIPLIKKQILDSISKITDLNICRSFVFLKEFGGKIEYVLFQVTLTPKYDTVRYIDIINRMKNVHNELLYRTYDKSSTLLGLTITSGSDIYKNIDTKDGIELGLFGAQIVDLYCGNILSVTSLAHCLRVSLGTEEFTLITDTAVASTDVVLINATGKKMYPNNYELSNNGSVSVCISEYIPNISEYIPKTGPKRKSTNILVEEAGILQTENELLDTYIYIGLGVLLVLVIAAIVYLHSSKNISPQPHNTQPSI